MAGDGYSVGAQVELHSLEGFEGRLADNGGYLWVGEPFDDFIGEGYVGWLFGLTCRTGGH